MCVPRQHADGPQMVIQGPWPLLYFGSTIFKIKSLRLCETETFGPIDRGTEVTEKPPS